MRAAFAIAFMCAAAGCATQNLPGTTAYAIVDRYLLPEGLFDGNDASAASRVVIKRDKGLLGSALIAVSTIGGRGITVLRPGEYVEFLLQPDEYLFGVSWADALGAGSTREVAVNCRPGQKYYLRIFPVIANGLTIERTSK